MLVEKTKLEWTNIIAGISSKGNFFYCINRGKVNANIVKWFLLKLCAWLNSVDKQWRLNTIIILDNAGYHRTLLKDNWFTKMKIPAMYVGPYHFKLSPIELYFNYIKGFNLQVVDKHYVSNM